MFETSIRITFLSDWHVGSGLGDGAIADSILTRDINGLPYIPGRAIKGALREGSWRLGLCRGDLAKMTDWLWGTDSAASVSNRPGRVTVASGRLPQDIAACLLSPDGLQYVTDMTILRAQTALDRNKMVVPASLRTIECGIPGLCFDSRIFIDAPELGDAWLSAYLAALCAAVKSIGADRARGLGNCRLDCGTAKGAPVLPAPLDLQILQPAEAAQ